MKSITLTQGKVAIVDDGDFDWLNQYTWCAYKSKKTWYANTNIGGKAIDMHRLITGANKGELVDHRDLDGLNNRRINLRKCTLTENNRNQGKRKDNTSGYKGVTARTRWGRTSYEAKIKVDSRTIHLGVFPDAITAAKAYDAAAKLYHGSFARLNFPEN